MIRRLLISLGLILSLLGLVIGMMILRQSKNALVPPTQFVPIDGSHKVVIDGIDIPVELATTDDERRMGLSGRSSLDADKGLLFVFETPGIYQFWMPDMNFPIDILWIEDGKVVDVDEQVSNIFDQKKPSYYSPSAPVRYVLEVNAGFVREHDISIGDPVDLIIP